MRHHQMMQEMGSTEAEQIAARDRLVRMRGYCTKANPQVGCTPVAGVAKPMTASVLTSFKELQFQLSRILVKEGKDPIAIDGRIGSATVRALETARKASPAFAFPQKTVDDVAFWAPELVRITTTLANTIGAPKVVVETKPAQPSMPTSGGGVAHPPDEVVASASPGFDFGGLSWKSPLVLAAVGVGALLLLRGRGRGRSRSRQKKGRR